MNFFEKAIKGFKQPQTEHVVPDTALAPAVAAPVAHAQPNVKKHVLVNPKCAFVNYELFSLCENIPVAVESESAALTGICDTIQLPTKDFLPQLRELTKAPNEVAANPANRVVYEIKLNNGKKMYIYPCIKHPKKPWISFEKTVAFNVTPELNRTIVSVLKKYTR